MRYFLIILVALLTACGSALPTVKPFKMDIQQGNVVTSKMLLQLRPGMTKSQVKFIMGSPLIVDSFHTNRWDYFYQMRQVGKIVEQRRVILDFDKDLLTKVRGDVVPEGTAGAATGEESRVAKTITVEPKAKQETRWTDKLKFWKKDETVKDVVKPETASPKKDTPESIVREAVKPLPTDALEANTSAPAGDASTITSESSNAEVPSVLAVPIGGVLTPESPSTATPSVEAPTESAAVVVAPVIETPKVEVAAPTRPAETKPKETKPKEIKPKDAKSAAKRDERLIFRMDKNLDLKNIDLKNIEAPVESAPASIMEDKGVSNKAQPSNAQPSSAKPNKPEPPLPPDEKPGYFERMLEKIGF